MKINNDELKIIKIDMDVKTKKELINNLIERLSYLYDLEFIYIDTIEKIEIVKKTKYSCKIYLNESFNEMKDLVLFQLIMGSDWRKEVNTLYNCYVLNMNYANRMFDVKKYKYRKYKSAIKEDITNEIMNKLKDENRKKAYN